MVSCSQDGGQSKKMACVSFGQSGIIPKIMVEIASNLGRMWTLRPTTIFSTLTCENDFQIPPPGGGGGFGREFGNVFKFLAGNLKTFSIPGGGDLGWGEFENVTPVVG